jgi:hypothetical protein
MNRRNFLACAGAALSWRLVPTRDDSRKIQALVDAGEPIPVGEYWLRRPIDFRGRHVSGRHSIYHLHDGAHFLADDTMTGEFSRNYLKVEGPIDGWFGSWRYTEGTT